jgi:GAF domain-containing protein
MANDEANILNASQSLLERLRPGDLDATLAAITRAAVEVLPMVQYSSITMRHRDGSLDSYALTDELLQELDDRQFELQEGPCFDGTTNDLFAASSDLRADERYPNYGPVAAAVGIRSQAGIRLFENNRTSGGLNLYSHNVGAFEDIQTVAQLFAHQAAVALSYSIEVKTLREAVQTRTRIGQAVGIVMERYKIPEQHAFAFLTRLSQNRNVKLRLIADELIQAASEV